MSEGAIIRDLVADVLSREPAVAAAYLFGSIARGTATGDSDVDIGVVYGRGGVARSVHERVVDRLVLAIARATGRELVDVVDLAAQGPIFGHRVLSEGALIYEADPQRRIDFASETIVRALDFRPTYELATRGKATALRSWLRESGLVKRE